MFLNFEPSDGRQAKKESTPFRGTSPSIKKAHSIGSSVNIALKSFLWLAFSVTKSLLTEPGWRQILQFLGKMFVSGGNSICFGNIPNVGLCCLSHERIVHNFV